MSEDKILLSIGIVAGLLMAALIALDLHLYLGIQ